VSAEHEGILPDFELEQINLPTIEYVTPETIVILVYGRNTFMRFSEETIKKAGEEINATYHYESNVIYMNVYAHTGMKEEEIELKETTTKIHELTHVVQNQLRVYEEWECLRDGEAAAYALSIKYLFLWKHKPLPPIKIRYSFRYLNPDRDYSKSGNCSISDKVFWEKIILPNKREVFGP
jgi:hypothetical protein